MLARLFYGIKSPADQESVLYYIMPTFALKSPADKDPVLYNSILARFFSYKVACWSRSSGV